ncbi:protein translocase subunit SecF [Halioxenophilus sp. WMMB6]|uniref:protein translocase subunit SecF n=1 Tax=Halioxenophilus sp. WMMB6 TaxID=3073815 RepID=UPI00295E43BA|nr:protein translocase subunit SecF [Halioxenophilus sp. WMMB6]
MSETNLAAPSHLKIIPFMKFRKLAMAFSLLLVLGSIVSLAVNGLQFGLDFTGGTQIQLQYPKPANLETVRSQLAKAGFDSAEVVYFGQETEVKVVMQEMEDSRGKAPGEPTLTDRVVSALSVDGDQVTLKSSAFVGPQVGEELRDLGGLGMVVALLVVMGYVAFRFQYKFSIGAVTALIHDVIIVLGVFSIFHLDFDLNELAAVLAVIGYSLNDTIVVADRIRENFRKIRQTSALEIVDISLTETLGRTIVTSLTTLLVLVALFFVGGEIIHGFSIALIVGIVIGTYSSIYVAANILLMLEISPQDLIEPVKEGADLDELP